jgi:hypothetical protein
VEDTTMLRLALGLLLACALLYGAYRGLRPGAPPPAAQQAAARREGVNLPASGPGAARQVVDDLKKIENAAMERTLNAGQAAEGR